MQRLTDDDRAFFARVSRAIFLNPFGEARHALDREILGEVDLPDERYVEALIGELEERLRRLGGAEMLQPGELAPKDWRLVEHAVLFECFHRHDRDLDRLIEEQLAAGAEPVKVPWARDALGRLIERGIRGDRAPRMLALFWQLRRAYYFIARRLTGRSPSMRRLRERLWNAVFTHDIARFEGRLWDRLEDFSVVLRGETGTGKGQAAAAIGRSGFLAYETSTGTFEDSFTELFLPLNLSQFPESLLESELFGHRKGAFTGAVDAHEGALTRCRAQGVVFLDEIGEVSGPVQVKLLQVLQDRVYSPVGSHEVRRFEGRVLAATHRDLDRLRAEGRFRDDFWYRLSSEMIEVPPLRVRLAETPEELGDLVGHLVGRILGAEDGVLAEAATAAIAEGFGPDYRWPGNVRELEQAVRRFVLSGHARPLEARVAPESPAEALLDAVRDGTLEARELVERYCAVLHARHGTFEEVARITGLDRRTVRKYVVGPYSEDGNG